MSGMVLCIIYPNIVINITRCDEGSKTDHMYPNLYFPNRVLISLKKGLLLLSTEFPYCFWTFMIDLLFKYATAPPEQLGVAGVQVSNCIKNITVIISSLTDYMKL